MPPILIGHEAPALKPIVTIDELLSNLAARQSGPVIHLDSSVALTKISVRRASTN
jgi:hypothetical protein